jgi:hypothetical protein
MRHIPLVITVAALTALPALAAGIRFRAWAE